MLPDKLRDGRKNFDVVLTRAVQPGGRCRIKAQTRCGWREAKFSAIAAPIEMPPTTARLILKMVHQRQQIVGKGGDADFIVGADRARLAVGAAIEREQAKAGGRAGNGRTAG